MSNYKPQFKVKATYMRGGTSKGTFFNIADLPKEAQEDTKKRDKLLQRIVGSPDVYKQQMDGMGGATSSTSKAILVGKSSVPNHDVDYYFCQVAIDQDFVDMSGNCGNLSSAVGPFAIHEGLVDNVPQNGVYCVLTNYPHRHFFCLFYYLLNCTFCFIRWIIIFFQQPSYFNSHPSSCLCSFRPINCC